LHRCDFGTIEDDGPTTSKPGDKKADQLFDLL
jgi:hypothetical protein